jgi:MoaA/NifB/PqqE/SkfB family radical SAM enzyme
MIEWSNANKYNSFNSFKGLTYYKQYENIVDWMNHKIDELIPPIECNLDPIARCNLSCSFCIGQRYLRNHREEIGNMQELPSEYMYRLVTFLSEWGVKGLCISGGGEPSLHKSIGDIISYASYKGMDVSFVTNATNIDDSLAESLLVCRWVALSIDSADSETYKKIKGADKFDAVVNNIKLLSEFRRASSYTKVDLCFKYLILPENITSIYNACKLAKELGVQDFHCRPVDWERKDMKDSGKRDYDMNLIEEQFMKCHEEETPDFHVYTVTHKFSPEFHVIHDFKKCLASPLIIPILTDGNAYNCVEKKMMANFRLGSCYPDPENILTWWGSDKHRDLIKSVNINGCSRCIYAQYNRQIEDVVMQDKMCRSFP